jgi:hypothetical protein
MKSTLAILVCIVLLVVLFNAYGCASVRVVGADCDVTVELGGAVAITDCRAHRAPCECPQRGPGAA